MPDPEEIQQQIEETRAELASTIDAIADRVHPKRVAARGVETVKGKVEDLRSRGTALPGPAGLSDDGSAPLPARVAGQLRQAKETKGKSVRWDRVALFGAGIALLIVVLRRRKR